MSSASNKKKIENNSTAEEVLEYYQTNLNGKVVIVTGSNSGTGLETARVLALAGAKVIIPCRTFEKSNGAIAYIKKTVPNADLIPMQLDLSDTASIKAFAKAFLDLNLPLHTLINNAGTVLFTKTFTMDGFETMFGVNHLGHFLLTQLLTEKLKESAPSRVIVVSSAGNSQLLSSNGIDFDNLNGEKKYIPAVAYGQSKLANILHAKELQRRFDEEGADITVTSLHPGNVESNLLQQSNLWLMIVFMSSIRNYRTVLREGMNKKKVTSGASTNIYCAISPDIVKGGFYSDNGSNTDLLNEQANNVEMAKKLWQVSEKMLAEKGIQL